MISRMKRPGQDGPPTINPHEKAKIDEEYMSLMAELGEGNAGKDGHSNDTPRFQLSSNPNIFQRSQAPRSIMAVAPPPPPPGVSQQITTSSQQPSRTPLIHVPYYCISHIRNFSGWNCRNYQQHSQPQPVVQPPKLPNPVKQNYMAQSWNQPPPPGMYWQPQGDMYWQPPPPPPPDSNPPPPPPN